MPVLDEQDFLLLREVIAKQAASLLFLVDRVMQPLTEEQREALRQALAAELGETGFSPDGPINERGTRIERLIDRLGHI
ncbi:MAG TPA: hypothetical protein VEK77_12130 [Gemmatimonadales bacterium]|nr:hypothetical protein [Gemmatimonadales bacterium]